MERTLNTIVDLSCSTLRGCDSAGVTVRVDGKVTTAAASDHYALEIDRIQYQSGEGPCLDTLETGDRHLVDAIAEESRWPEFCRRAAAEGFRSGTEGVLNLYSKSEGAFDEESMGIAEVFARQASIALENAAIYLAARRLGAQLNETLASRDVIGRAKGILMEREGLSDPEAFEVLRRISQATNVKLREVAQRVVDEKPARPQLTPRLRPSRPSLESDSMSVVVARTVYLLGVVLGAGTAVNGFTDSSPLEWVTGAAMGLAIWWIAAGIGVRLGVTPGELVVWLRSGEQDD